MAGFRLIFKVVTPSPMRCGFRVGAQHAAPVRLGLFHFASVMFAALLLNRS